MSMLGRAQRAAQPRGNSAGVVIAAPRDLTHNKDPSYYHPTVAWFKEFLKDGGRIEDGLKMAGCAEWSG